MPDLPDVPSLDVGATPPPALTPPAPGKPPPSPARPLGPGGAVGLSAVVMAVNLVIQVAVGFVFALVTRLDGSGHDRGIRAMELQSSGLLVSIAVLVSDLPCLALLGFLAKARTPGWLRELLALRPVQPSSTLMWLGVFFLYSLGVSIVTLALDPATTDFMRDAYRTAGQPWLFCLSLVLIAPLYEEALFRGFLFTGLERSKLGAAGAILVTSLVFSLIHLQYGPYEIMVIFGVGVILGWARARTGSIVPSLAIHVVMNLAAILEAIPP